MDAPLMKNVDEAWLKEHREFLRSEQSRRLRLMASDLGRRALGSMGCWPPSSKVRSWAKEAAHFAIQSMELAALARRTPPPLAGKERPHKMTPGTIDRLAFQMAYATADEWDEFLRRLGAPGVVACDDSAKRLRRYIDTQRTMGGTHVIETADDRRALLAAEIAFDLLDGTGDGGRLLPQIHHAKAVSRIAAVLAEKTKGDLR